MSRMRGFRAAKGAPATLAGPLRAHLDEISRRHRALGAVGEFWGSTVPPEIAPGVSPESLRRGVLTVRATDSASAFTFDRWLRSGGEAALQRIGGVRKIKIAPAAAPGPDGR